MNLLVVVFQRGLLSKMIQFEIREVLQTSIYLKDVVDEGISRNTIVDATNNASDMVQQSANPTRNE